MKKILIALLAVLLCLTFVACNGPAETTGGNDDVTTPEEGGVTPDVTTPEETTEPEVVDSDTLSVGEDNNTEFGPINQ